MEFTDYTVRENIGNDFFALQVCAVATDVALPADISFDIKNITAKGMIIACSPFSA